MFLPEDKVQIARLFTFFLLAERLACDCARHQSVLFPDQVSRRFFLNQSRQEKFHARVFECGIGILAPKGIGRLPANREMTAYRRLIESAVARNDLAESLLGMQVILEGLGDVALTHVSDGFGPRGFGFERVRKMIVGQEDAHHAYGVKRFLAFFDSEDQATASYQQRGDEYRGLAAQILGSVGTLFEHFDEDPNEYLVEFETKLPAFMQPMPILV